MRKDEEDIYILPALPVVDKENRCVCINQRFVCVCVCVFVCMSYKLTWVSCLCSSGEEEAAEDEERSGDHKTDSHHMYQVCP